ncbi:iron ABC transporter permease [Nocardioides sp. zg-ZUI104]|uniref:FecCD family ABC transporter permease n=1 Tax=Nocardioides faecalis TaxID=2803858 RepID=UPI001BD1987C|nr:iron ABC transporter permease [Nocardioides faecalis]MBS4751639.1 iron ABC transporter permease [Nocardioides faecalis]
MTVAPSNPAPGPAAPGPARPGRGAPRRAGAPAQAGWRGSLGNRVGLIGVLTVGLVVALVLGAGQGQMQIPASEVLGSILHRIGLDIGPLPSHPRGEGTLWEVRFPRVVLAALVGACLATAGAVMQGVFGNPLAEPGVVGVASGASVAAGAVIVFQISFLGSWTIAFAAFLGGLVATTLVYLLSRAGGRTEVVTLVLTGVAMNAMTSAALAFLMFLGDQQAREEIVFWTLGSLNGTRWEAVTVVAPLALVGIVAALLLARPLDLLSLGDRAAFHVGIDVERLRMVAIVVVAVLTAAAVAFAGTIAFVGLVVPHLIRMIAGPGHRLLIPASALGGAVLLTFADLWARTAIDNADLPIGMLTALVGGPFFFWLIRRSRRTAGGWA